MTRKRISSASFTPSEIEMMYDVVRNAGDASTSYAESEKYRKIQSKLKPLFTPAATVSLFAEIEKIKNKLQKSASVTPIKLNPH